jgi:hypothetical protein
MKLTTFDKDQDLSEIEKLFFTDESFDIKDMPTKDKIGFIEYCLSKTDATNTQVLTNVILIVLGGTLDNALFDRQDIYFNSLMEYLDIKTALKAQIDQFSNQLLKYFIGAIKGYYSLLVDNKVPIPVIYGALLSVANLDQISKLFMHADFNVKDVPQVQNSKAIIDGFCIRNKLSQEFLKLFSEK